MKVDYILILIISILRMKNAHNSEKVFSSFIEIDESSIGENNKIEGKMNINNEMYDAKCDCDPVAPPILDKDVKCKPSKLSIIAEREGQGASYEEIKYLVGDITELTFVKITTTSFKCLDGRNSKGILGTPGGDAGEFILALSVYENFVLQGNSLTQDDVHNIFAQYLSNIPIDKFYMCTDDMAISHLERELSIEGLNINNPRTQLLSELFNLITKPENIGDLNMKMMLKYPEQFSIRKELVTMFLNSFYKILWNKTNELNQKIELEILTGDHKESAFVEVRSDSTCIAKQLAPLIKAKNKSTSVFISHLDAVYLKRYQIAHFFAEIVSNKTTSIDPLVFFEKLIQQGYKSLENTGSYIAKGLPFYTINLS